MLGRFLVALRGPVFFAIGASRIAVGIVVLAVVAVPALLKWRLSRSRGAAA